MRESTEEPKISANEINRYMYCPYQWYYKRHYGNKALQEQYKALGLSSSNHENYYTKGMKHHTHYHQAYRMKRLLQGVLIVVIFALILRMVIG